MSKVMSLRLEDDQVARLERAARQLGHTPARTAVLLLEEGLRQRDFPGIEFRDSPAGRQAYLRGTRLAVWHVVMLARHFDDPVALTAAHLEVPIRHIAAALDYAAAYSEEINAALGENAAETEDLQQALPACVLDLSIAPALDGSL
jgi:uncharacterized protein (DUF433 family)